MPELSVAVCWEGPVKSQRTVPPCGGLSVDGVNTKSDTVTIPDTASQSGVMSLADRSFEMLVWPVPSLAFIVYVSYTQLPVSSQAGTLGSSRSVWNTMLRPFAE